VKWKWKSTTKKPEFLKEALAIMIQNVNECARTDQQEHGKIGLIRRPGKLSINAMSLKP
jgi:hypothetical protein